MTLWGNSGTRCSSRNASRISEPASVLRFAVMQPTFGPKKVGDSRSAPVELVAGESGDGFETGPRVDAEGADVPVAGLGL